MPQRFLRNDVLAIGQDQAAERDLVVRFDRFADQPRFNDLDEH
jgi:hypothetical protein